VVKAKVHLRVQETAREQDNETGLPGELPTLSAVEKSFIAQLISGPNKDVINQFACGCGLM
jgi:hypothetical protein